MVVYFNVNVGFNMVEECLEMDCMICLFILGIKYFRSKNIILFYLSVFLGWNYVWCYIVFVESIMGDFFVEIVYLLLE